MLGKIFICIAFSMAPVLSGAQDRTAEWTASPGFEVFGSLAMGHVFRYEDRGFGNRLNLGAGVEAAVWRGLRVGTEINRVFGLQPDFAECGAVLIGPGQPLPCTGESRRGVASATAASIAAAYYFGKGRLQPFLAGGLSLITATEYNTQSIVHPDHVEFREHKFQSTGIGPTMGVGIRASLTRHVSVRPEIRFSDATALSGLNLSQWRLSMGVAYGW